MKKISNLVAAEMNSLMANQSFGFGKFASKKSKKMKKSCCANCGDACDCGKDCKCKGSCSQDCSNCGDKMSLKSANEMFNIILKTSAELDEKGFDKAASLLLIASNKLLKEAQDSEEMTNDILSEMGEDSLDSHDDMMKLFERVQKEQSQRGESRPLVKKINDMPLEAFLAMHGAENPEPESEYDFRADDKDMDSDSEEPVSLEKDEDEMEEESEESSEEEDMLEDEEEMSREELLVLLKDCKEQLDEILENEEDFDQEEVLELLDCMHEIEELLKSSEEDEEFEALKEEDEEMDEEMDEFEEMDEEEGEGEDEEESDEDEDEDEDEDDLHHMMNYLSSDDDNLAWEDEL